MGQAGNVSSNGAVCTGDTVCEVPGLTKGAENQVLVNIPIINKTVDLTNYSLFTMSLILGTIDGFKSLCNVGSGIIFDGSDCSWK